MSRTAWARRDYAARKERGDCVATGCPERAAEDAIYCPGHRDARRAYYRAYYAKTPKRRKAVVQAKRVRHRARRAAGLCLWCSRPARTQFCERCAPRERASRGMVEPTPHTFCVACGKRGHWWESCPRPTDQVHAVDFMRSGRSSLGEA